MARYALSTPGNFAVIMGRSVVPTVLGDDGKPYFGDGYEYRYGRMETIRSGEKVVLVAAGNMLPNALKAWHKLNAEGVRVRWYRSPTGVNCTPTIWPCSAGSRMSSCLRITT